MMTEDEIYSLKYAEEEKLKKHLRSGDGIAAIRSQAYIDVLDVVLNG